MQGVGELKEFSSLSSLMQLVLEADGYQPYVLSLEKGLKSLIRKCLELAKDPPKSYADEVHRILKLFLLLQMMYKYNYVQGLIDGLNAGVKSLCGKIWSPILLTGFGTLVTIVGVVHKFAGLRALELSIQTEKQAY